MKRISSYITIALVAAAFSCTKNEVEQSGTISLSVKATTVESPKVTIGAASDNKYPMLWDDSGESLKLLEVYGAGTNEYVSKSYSCEVGNKAATFSFELTETASSTYDYYFLSPSSAYNYSFPTYGTIGVFLPASQTSGTSSVDPAAAILFAKEQGKTVQGGDLDVDFDHICSYVKMNLVDLATEPGETINSVSFSAQGKTLSGLNAYNWNTGEYTPVAGYSYDNVVVNVPAGITPADFTVWFTCWPAEFAAGDKLAVSVKTNAGEHTRVITLGAAKSFVSGHVAQLKVDMSQTAKVISELYLLGPGGPAGWDLGAMPALKAGGAGVFSWEGYLNASQEFRFPTQKIAGVWFPCLVIDEDNNKVLYDPDSSVYYSLSHQYVVSTSGNYRIVIDTHDYYNMTYSVTPVSFPANDLYILGDASPGGWSLAGAPAMTDKFDGTFTWTGTLNAGSFRLNTINTDWFPSIMLTSTGKPVYVANGAYDGTQHFHFTVAEAGTYKLDVNLQDRNNITYSLVKQ